MMQRRLAWLLHKEDTQIWKCSIFCFLFLMLSDGKIEHPISRGTYPIEGHFGFKPLVPHKQTIKKPKPKLNQKKKKNKKQ